MAACCSAAMPAIQKLSHVLIFKFEIQKLKSDSREEREFGATRAARARESESAEGGFAMRDEELYDVLGVTREATDSEIRRAYR